MSQERHGIKSLGLSLLVALSAMAITAVGAQAHEFRIDGGTFTAKAHASVTFSGTIALGHLLVASGIAIHCQSGEVSGTALLGGTVHASALFKECSVLENKFCKIYETKADHEAGANAGNIIASGLGLLLLHAGVHYLKVEGVVLSTIWLGGKLCTLPLENVVSGSTAFKLPTALTELVTQGAETISSATAALLGVQLKYGLENASLDGGATSVKLTGALVGKTFGAE